MLSKIKDWFQPRPEGRFTQPDLDKGETLELNFSGTRVSFKVETGPNLFSRYSNQGNANNEHIKQRKVTIKNGKKRGG